MKRGGPLKRTTPLKSNSKLRRTPLRSRSKERQDFMQNERIPLIESLVEAGFRCEIGPVFAHYGLDEAKNCTGKIEGLHELRKRSAGGSLKNPDNLVPACNQCNAAIENNPDEAHVMGLVIREGDEEWDRLGVRNDINLD